MADFSQLPPDLSQSSPLPAMRVVEGDRGWWHVFRSPYLLGFWAIPTLLVSVGASFWAIRSLLTLPELPGCRSISQISESSSMRLYCAEELADSKTAEDLRRAIQLIHTIPEGDSLKPQSDRAIVEWSRQMLELGEAEFQQGDLQAAIKIAEKVPSHGQTRQTVDDQIKQWETLWERAETIYDDALDEIDQGRWGQAITVAKGLLAVENRYWSTARHRELMQQLQAAQDAEKEEKTRQATRPTPRFSSRSSDPIEDFFAERDRERAAESSQYLSQARNLANSGDLEAAITEASKILFGTPRYEEAQQAIETWEDQIEVSQDRPYLDRARELAQQGNLESLEAAIYEADRISWGRSLYDTAQTQIDQWREQVAQLRLQQQNEQLESLDNSNFYPTEPASLIPEAIPSPEVITVPILDERN